MTQAASTPSHEPNSLPWPKIPVSNKEHTNAAVVIVGGGIAGMCQAINLLKEGIRNFIILERGGGFGGTWRANKFPGAGCDVWSHLYSYSFEKSPRWTRAYPGQEEILEYLVDVASKYQLYKYARFNTEVVAAKWSEKQMKWETSVKVRGGQDAEYGAEYTITSDYVVTAVGQLSTPKLPNIQGISDFGGKLMHTARWDWSYSLEGKRVAIIGTGATAGQVVPEVAKVAGHLTVFQRSPTYVFPRHDEPIAPWMRTVLKYVPFAYTRYRAGMMDTRERFHDMITNKGNFREFVLKATDQKMKADLPNRPDLWEKFRPQFKPGCKRPVISDDYYPTFLKDNVTLETRSIRSVQRDGVNVQGEKEELLPFDVLICATGFDSFAFLPSMEVTTRSGQSLKSLWGPSPYSLRGISAPDCPNFAMLFGPNSGLSHNSLYLIIEAQSRVVTRMIGAVMDARRNGQTLALNPKQAQMEQWNEAEQAAIGKTSYVDPACNCWWKNSEGRVTNQYHGTAIQYQKEMSLVRWSEYDAFGTGAGSLAVKGDEHIGRVVEETRVRDRTIGIALGGLVMFGAAFFYLQR